MWVLLLSRLRIAQSQAQVGVGRGGATVRARVGGEARMHAVFVCAQSPLQYSRGDGGLAIRLSLVGRDRLAGPDIEVAAR
jgi:hypothetical protein